MPPTWSEPPRRLLVSGCYRSGTTLLEKMLHAHGELCVASQPFPVLYFRAKEAFLRARQLERRYPFDHLFLEDGYQGEELATFLDGHRLDASDIDALFEALAGYTEGLWTPEVLKARGGIAPGTFAEVHASLLQAVATLLGKDGAPVVGGKEILCEEMLPWLVSRGGLGVIIVRDPRDMIASLNFRERDNATGAARPVLYSLRNWRKSVALALHLEDQAGFAWLKYEDLVSRPLESLAPVTDALGVARFGADRFTGGIETQGGERWKGNSSFDDADGLSSKPIGRFRTILPEPVVAYIESVCAPEMQLLGYAPEVGASTQAIRAYRDPAAGLHAKFDAEYSSQHGRVDAELKRLDLLHDHNRSKDLDAACARRWFISERAWHRLSVATGDQDG